MDKGTCETERRLVTSQGSAALQVAEQNQAGRRKERKETRKLKQEEMNGKQKCD